MFGNSTIILLLVSALVAVLVIILIMSGGVDDFDVIYLSNLVNIIPSSMDFSIGL